MCWMCEEQEKKKPTTWLGRMYDVFVYDNGALIGSGYVIVDDMSGAHEPVLRDLHGNYLNGGIYQIQVSDKNPVFVTVSGSKH